MSIEHINGKEYAALITLRDAVQHEATFYETAIEEYENALRHTADRADFVDSAAEQLNDAIHNHNAALNEIAYRVEKAHDAARAHGESGYALRLAEWMDAIQDCALEEVQEADRPTAGAPDHFDQSTLTPPPIRPAAKA